MAAYEKQTWETGDTITAEKLIHIENGIYGIWGVNCNDEIWLRI